MATNLIKTLFSNIKLLTTKKLKKYLLEHHHKIMSSIFCNIHRKDLHVNNRTIKEHFFNKRKSVGRGKFLKQCKDTMYASCW